ncbi:MAG TPA: hypothetical protein DCY25_12980, partial [Bacteroidales bacterium]|nr:hypothetical protein [Bacteroidales bacterium]
MIGNRNIGIVNVSARGDLIIRNLNSMLKVILFILILAAGGNIRSFGQSICPAAPLGYQYQKTFEINGSRVGGVLINFPVLVVLNPPNSNSLANILDGGHVCDPDG